MVIVTVGPCFIVYSQLVKVLICNISAIKYVKTLNVTKSVKKSELTIPTDNMGVKMCCYNHLCFKIIYLYENIGLFLWLFKSEDNNSHGAAPLHTSQNLCIVRLRKLWSQQSV